MPRGSPGGDCGRGGAARAAVAGGRGRADRWARVLSERARRGAGEARAVALAQRCDAGLGRSLGRGGKETGPSTEGKRIVPREREVGRGFVLLGWVPEFWFWFSFPISFLFSISNTTQIYLNSKEFKPL